MNKNGLCLKKLLSKASPVENIQDVATLSPETWENFVQKCIPSKSKVVAYLDYAVLAGKYESGKFVFDQNQTFEPKYIQRLRIFNEREELLLWRSGVSLKGRIRTDEEGEEVDVVEANQILFGTQSKACGDFTRIWEERGTELVLPGEFCADKPPEGQKPKRVAIHTRNYIGFMENGLATYTDCRFVEFVQIPQVGEKHE